MSQGSRAVLVSGSTGLVGTALCAELLRQGASCVPLVRQPGSGIHWDPVAGTVESAKLEGAEAVVHLAGENIVSGRWTEKRLDRIRNSRIQGTRLIAEALAGLETRPRVLVCASAVGFYGNRGDQELDETSEAGVGLLPELCREWEAACAPAKAAGIRVVNLRIGVVLAREGGALAKMLLPFKAGVGGKIGHGRQQLSWISLPDLVGVIRHVLECDDLEGPINATAPVPVSNLEFTKILGSVLHRPTILPLPGFAVRLLFGQMGDELLLSGQRVIPRRLSEHGFAFQHPDLRTALQALLV